MYKRYISDLEKYLENGRVLMIFGPRRVGKTTLVTDFFNKFNGRKLFVTGDDISIQNIFNSSNKDSIEKFARDLDLLVIDEAQIIEGIGHGLKILIDSMPGLKIIVTGSSSFELAGQTGEPLVGRKWEITMYPISLMELKAQYSLYEIDQMLPQILVYGSYPAVLNETSEDRKKEVLNELANSYLFKDILAFQDVKGSKVLFDILKLLAFQIGSEVSLSEIANKVGIDYKTVARYIDLFEKAYILYALHGYSNNLREEVTSKAKYYFYDNGLRNAIISAYNNLDTRNDIGQLWENFLVSERLKVIHYKKIYSNQYFWRTWEQKEIDWIEERDGKLFVYEFKYNDGYSKHRKAFQTVYPNSEFEIINSMSYENFLGLSGSN